MCICTIIIWKCEILFYFFEKCFLTSSKFSPLKGSFRTFLCPTPLCLVLWLKLLTTSQVASGLPFRETMPASRTRCTRQWRRWFIGAFATERSLLMRSVSEGKKKEAVWGFMEASKQGSHLWVSWEPFRGIQPCLIWTMGEKGGLLLLAVSRNIKM